MTTGDVEISILDGGGSVVVPSSSVQPVLGTSSSGTAGQVVASRNPNTIAGIFGAGPLVEDAAMSIAKGATVLAVKLPSATAGAATAVTSTALGGTSVVTVTGTPTDTAFVKMKVIVGGTIASAGSRVQVSYDAGRTYGPVIALGTANTLVLDRIGVSFAFAAGTLVAGATFTFGTTEPLGDAAGVLGALSALQASPYALTGWGAPISLAGVVVTGALAGTINGYVNTLATGKLFTRMIGSARDASGPAAYGGTAETEATWTSAVLADFGAADCKRITVGAGHYNMPLQIPSAVAGVPLMRRPFSWSLASRQTQIPIQRHAGRVRDGSLLDIVVDPVNDPNDGFVYHDERLNPTLDVGRFATARTRIKKQGYYCVNPNLMSATGSVYTLLPLGLVMDAACGIVYDVGQNDINEDIRLNRNGTIFENEAKAIESAMRIALQQQLVNKNALSDANVSVDRGSNVRNDKKVNVAVSIFSRGYLLEADISIGFASDNGT